MISAFFARGIILVFGTLFPAYYSYKAVKTKNVKEYVKWMMYWIVFAFFTCFETITDLFMAFWFPFYYELKILLVLWLLSPATRGSSVLYRKFVHPWLTQREEEIDECIAKAKQQGYSTVLTLGTKGVNYATSVIMQTAIKGGGGLVNQLKRSYSVGELAEDQIDARNGDHNSNVLALPPGHDIGDYRHHPPTHTGTATTAAPTVQQQAPSAEYGDSAPVKRRPAAGASLKVSSSSLPVGQQQVLSSSQAEVSSSSNTLDTLSEDQSSSDELSTSRKTAKEGPRPTRSMPSRNAKLTGCSRTRLFY